MDDMRINHGFSLLEVLVSLLLVTSTSLALLKQQWHVSQLVVQLEQQGLHLLLLDSASERARAR